MLFTAGHSLTTGGFFTYFLAEFQPTGSWYALLLIAPETASSLSVLTRAAASLGGSRKTVWLAGLLGGRLAALLIPMALFWPENPAHKFTFLLVCTVVWYLLQAIGYVSLVSWISELVPEVNWGKLFSRQQIGKGIVSLTVPLAAGLLRAYYIRGLPVEQARWTYAVIFLAGGILTMGSVVPLLSLPDVPWKPPAVRRAAWLGLRTSLTGGLLLLLAGRWWLAFFQGLSQAVMTKYSIETLKVSLETYYVLTSLMWSLQLALTAWAGRLSDRNKDKSALFRSLLLVSLGTLCWSVATPAAWWWLIPAYAIWGLFGMVNLAGNNLCLKLAPHGDNFREFALYDQVSGLIAGMAGLIGGWWLDSLLAAQGLGVGAFQWIFFVSFLGRLTSALWIVPIRQPRAEM